MLISTYTPLIVMQESRLPSIKAMGQNRITSNKEGRRATLQQLSTSIFFFPTTLFGEASGIFHNREWRTSTDSKAFQCQGQPFDARQQLSFRKNKRVK
jgi:hypothetical protein